MVVDALPGNQFRKIATEPNPNRVFWQDDNVGVFLSGSLQQVLDTIGEACSRETCYFWATRLNQSNRFISETSLPSLWQQMKTNRNAKRRNYRMSQYG